MDVWLFPYGGEVDLGRATTREVALTRWASWQEIELLWGHRSFLSPRWIISLQYDLCFLK